MHPLKDKRKPALENSRIINSLATVFLVIFTVSTSAATTQETLPKSNSSSATSVFNHTSPIIIVTPENNNIFNDKLAKDWYQSPITQKSGMFNPVFLPFEYICKAGSNDVKQSMTFPCLLSFKFDFVPDNFSARHPAFIYRKMPIWNVKLGETQKIINYITYWEATHAIGGTVTQDIDGYTGEMVVLDQSGHEVVRQQYTQPVPYFTLMGDMVKTWMQHCSQSISEGLYQELIRPMTTDMGCVELYGQSFYMSWRTQKEWDVYDEILERDPNFAEVRFWYANQKSWTLDSNSKEYAQLKTEKGKALKSHLVMSALNEFDFSNCPDEKLVRDCEQILKYAASICTENTTVLSAILESQAANLSIKDLDKMLPIAEKYPCDWNLLATLAWQYDKRGCYEKSFPLLLSAIHSGYLKGTGRFDWEWGLLARDFYRLGYLDESIFCGQKAIKDAGKKASYNQYLYLGLAYKDRHAYKAAARFFKLAHDRNSNYGANLLARLCIYQDGDIQLLNNSQYSTAKATSYDLETARQKLSKGMYEKALSYLLPKVKSPTLPPKRDIYALENELTCSDIYCFAGDLPKAKKHAFRAWYIRPQSREVAYLLGQSWKDNTIGMQRYLKTASFIYSDDPTWAQLTDMLKISLKKEPYENVIQEYNQINNKLKSLPKEDIWAFWQQFSPFEIEYICLYLIQEGNAVISRESLEFYKTYRDTTKRISVDQDANSWLFLLQMQNLHSAKHTTTAASGH